MKSFNLISKRKTKKELKAIRSANDSSSDFLNYLKENHQLSPEELNNVDLIINHFQNLNIIFSDMERSMQKK